MPRNHVIKKDDLPEDQIEPVTLDENAFYKRRTRIPRARVDFDEDVTSPRADRYNYQQQGVLPRDAAELDATPYEVPLPSFEHTDVPVETDSAAPVEDAEIADEEEPDPLDVLREELEAEWQEKLEQAASEARTEGREQGHEKGYDEGYAAAHAELAEQFDADVERLATDVAQLKQLWRDYIEASEPDLIEIAVDVAEALLDAPLPESIRGASARSIAEAVEELAGAGMLTVSLHPVDYQRLQENGLIDQLNANHASSLRWHPDPEQPEGDWSVESPEAVIRHYKSEILDTIDQMLGTPAPGAHGKDAAADTDSAA